MSVTVHTVEDSTVEIRWFPREESGPLGGCHEFFSLDIADSVNVHLNREQLRAIAQKTREMLTKVEAVAPTLDASDAAESSTEHGMPGGER